MPDENCSTCKFARTMGLSSIDAPRDAHGDRDHAWDDENPDEPIWLFRCYRFPPQYIGRTNSNIIKSKGPQVCPYPDDRHPNCWDHPVVVGDDYCGEYSPE